MTSSALLLSVGYEPLHIVAGRRALVLVLGGKADVVTEGDEVVHSEHLEMPVPSVIRLRYFVRVPFRAHLPLTRRNVVTRDRGRCVYCGGRGNTVDHVIPRSRGGEHVWHNVVTACLRCNGHKADRTLDELGWSLGVTPRAPSAWSWLLVDVDANPSWEPWIVGSAAVSTSKTSSAP